jgi:hypothetical protein
MPAGPTQEVKSHPFMKIPEWVVLLRFSCHYWSPPFGAAIVSLGAYLFQMNDTKLHFLRSVG